MRNRLRERLDAGAISFGAVVSMVDPRVVELVGLSGFDLVYFELEHHAIGLETLENHLRAAMARDLAVIVRTPGQDPSTILRVLDIGAEGVLIPGIRSEEQVAAAVAASRFPPLGMRSLGGLSRSADFGAHRAGPSADLQQLAATRNKEVVVGVMIEEQEALERIVPIVRTPGLDFVVLGLQGIAASLGLIGTTSHARMVEAFERIVTACGNAGVPFGMVVYHPLLPFSAAQLSERGGRLLQGGGDVGLMLNALRRHLAEMKTEVA